MPPEIRLFTPGPTPVPERVRQAGAVPMIHHRSEEFGAILGGLRSNLKEFCGTSGEVVLFASSGSGAMEATVSSIFQPGDEVVVVEAGKFGQRWEALAKHYQLQAKVVRQEWGQAVDAARVLEAVGPATKAVLIQACESSTGVFHPIQEIGRRLQESSDALFVVDAITALGIHDIRADRDGIDALICASQKAFMCPPGLAFVALSSRALGRVREKGASHYFSIARELAAQKKNSTAFTPAISLCLQLAEALRIMGEEGYDALIRRHRLMQRMAREAFAAMGLALFNSDADACLGITVARNPAGLDNKKWLKEIRKTHGLWLAGGQDQLEGKIFRISHMGAIHPGDLIEGLELLEDSLKHALPRARSGEGAKRARAARDEAGR